MSKTFRIPLDRPATLKYRVTHPRSTARHRAFQALRDISFDVAPGEFLGIIGHNGSGKSTLLKILSGIYVADGGTVEIDGRVSPFLELGVGFNHELTARENVFLSGAVLGLTRRELAGRVDEIIAFAGIEEFAGTKLKNLSSGMQVRLAFSLAIQADAGILLMDEVLAVGDVSFQEKCFEVFSNYKRQGRTIVLVTHDMNAVHMYCDRALLLDHGRLVIDGSPGEVTTQYRRIISLASDRASEASEPAADTSTEDAASVRFGDGTAKLTSVRMLDDAGAERSTFTTGLPLTVEVRVRAGSRGAEELMCSFSIQRTDGLDLAHAVSAWTHCASPPLGPGATVVFRHRIPDLDLLQGAYFLNAGIYALYGHQPVDVVERQMTFRVTDELGRPGLLALAGSWSVDVEAAVEEPLAVDEPPSVAAAVE
ncbi:MAG TPA: ABC transporter ATP-binding protein [Candidatus Dormibacteraeota bacterium]|nr:ABC transporter ATP-binding protein [Candidatus Dormibacteraeota bacterium]